MSALCIQCHFLLCYLFIAMFSACDYALLLDDALQLKNHENCWKLKMVVYILGASMFLAVFYKKKINEFKLLTVR